MSKVVKKVGKAIKKVVKGVVKGVKKVWKKIKQSKVLKVIAAAALVYFGGAAIMGGLGGAAGGGGFAGFLKGAATGMGNAWSSLGSAASSVMHGQFGAAGSNLMAGIKGQTINTATGAVTKVVSGGANAIVNAGTQTAAQAGTQGATQLGAQAGTQAGGGKISMGVPDYVNPATGGAGGGAAPPGLIEQAGQQAAGNVVGDQALTQGISYGQGIKDAAKITVLGQGASQGIGAVMNSRAAEKQAEAEALAVEEARRMYGENVGAPFVMPVFNPMTGRYEIPNAQTQTPPGGG